MGGKELSKRDLCHVSFGKSASKYGRQAPCKYRLESPSQDLADPPTYHQALPYYGRYGLVGIFPFPISTKGEGNALVRNYQSEL